MENSVTLTLARYHDLIDIERDLMKLKKNQLDQYSQSELFEKHTVIIESLRNENDDLRQNVEQSKRIVFYVFGAFCLVILFIVLSAILAQ